VQIKKVGGTQIDFAVNTPPTRIKSMNKDTNPQREGNTLQNPAKFSGQAIIA